MFALKFKEFNFLDNESPLFLNKNIVDRLRDRESFFINSACEIFQYSKFFRHLYFYAACQSKEKSMFNLFLILAILFQSLDEIERLFSGLSIPTLQSLELALNDLKLKQDSFIYQDQEFLDRANEIEEKIKKLNIKNKAKASEDEQNLAKLLPDFQKIINKAIAQQDFSKIEEFFIADDRCIQELNTHSLCPFYTRNKTCCPEEERSCQLDRINKKKQRGKTDQECNFLFILACIEELYFELDNFVLDIVRAASGQKIFGFFNHNIVLQDTEKSLCFISYDELSDRVKFEKIDENKSKDLYDEVKWY